MFECFFVFLVLFGLVYLRWAWCFGVFGFSGVAGFW